MVYILYIRIMFSVSLLYLYNPSLLFTCGGNKEYYYYYCLGRLLRNGMLHIEKGEITLYLQKTESRSTNSKSIKYGLIYLR